MFLIQEIYFISVYKFMEIRIVTYSSIDVTSGNLSLSVPLCGHCTVVYFVVYKKGTCVYINNLIMV